MVLGIARRPSGDHSLVLPTQKVRKMAAKMVRKRKQRLKRAEIRAAI
jgi:hypothetical protein